MMACNYELDVSLRLNNIVCKFIDAIYSEAIFKLINQKYRSLFA